ncbi:hypothetical protein H7I41_20870 [Mycobacterium manitobense]|uniref:Secreted protein n=1 Tax=[Mycobacterium] manitobense TaxID=190147 RepID=A0A9X2YD08_9MYCO|nr:hypothetical protein [[Mycobacterium] manitobense]MCV7172373.1 hypothetical protein [[Mycobacterium] manitobense]
MRKPSTVVASALAAGVAAFLLAAPIANADPPPPCPPDDQQCQEQQKNPGAGIANEVIDNVQQGVDQANEALNPKPSAGPGIMVLKNGVPWCMAFGQPIPPGAVIDKIHPSGMTSYC